MFTQLQRAGFLGASDMHYVMNDVPPEELLAWWERKVGLAEDSPPSYAMRLGSAVGDLILDEYARANGLDITRRQEVVASRANKRFRSTIDGMIMSTRTVTEAKFAGAHLRREWLFSHHYPQVAMQMHCTDADDGILVIGQGTADPFALECIDTLTPPVMIDLPPAPVPPERWRTVDLMSDNRPNWADEMLEQLANYGEAAPYVQIHEQAGKAAKALVPEDVGRIYAGAWTISRSKKGTLSIRGKGE
jgi:hypothetical protein